MRTLVIFLFVLGFAGCAFSVNVNGKKKYQSNNVLASLTDPTPPPVKVEIDSGFSPNPKRFEDLQAFITENLRQYKNTEYKCSGWVAHRPSIIFTNKGLRDVTLRTDARDSVMFVELEDGTFFCGENGAVTMEQAPAGEWRVYVGTKRKPNDDDKLLTYSLTIEDYGAPRDLGWSEAIPSSTLDGAPKDAIVFQGRVPSVANLRQKGGECRDYNFAEIPVQRVTLKRPIADVELVLTSPFAVAIEMMGPIPDDNRDIKARCYRNGRTKIKRLEPGRYAFRMGAKNLEEANDFYAQMIGPETLKDKMFIVKTMHADLPMKFLALKYHTPFLDSAAMQKNRALAESAFLSAPTGMFVYPKFALDKVSARPWSKTDAFPQKDEPLLILYDRVVITTDGLVYEMVKLDYLTTERPKVMVIPPQPRKASGKLDSETKRIFKKVVNRIREL